LLLEKGDSTVGRKYNREYTTRKPIDTILHKTSDGRWELAVDEEDNPLTRDDADEIEIRDPEQEGRFKKYRQVVQEVWTGCIVGDVLLYHMKSPYRHNRFPHIFMGGLLKNGESMPRGEIERLIDTQNLYNRLMTMFVDIMSRTSNPGMEVDPKQVDPRQRKDVLDIVSQPGWTLLRAEDAQPGRDAVKYHTSTALPTGILQLADMVRIMFDELFSIAQTQRGGMPYDTSGKAVIALQRAADTALNGLAGSLERAITEWGRLRLGNIVQFTKFRDAWRISDDVRNRSFKLVAERHRIPRDLDEMEQGKEPKIPEEIMNAPEPPPDYKDALGIRMYKDGKPGQPMDPDQNKFLVADLQSANMDVEIVLGSGEERSEEEKRKILELVFSATGDVKYLLEELEVKDASEIIDRMEKRNAEKQMAEQVQGLMEDEVVGPFLMMAMKNTDQLRQGVQANMTVGEILGMRQAA